MNAALSLAVLQELRGQRRRRAATAVAAPRARRSAIEALSAAGLPTLRDENWKYANLRPLERAAVRCRPRPPRSTAAQLPPPRQPATRARCSSTGSSPPRCRHPLRRPASVAAVAAPLPPHTPVRRSERATDQRFALLNEAFATDGARIQRGGRRSPRSASSSSSSRAPRPRSGTSYPRLEVQRQAARQSGTASSGT